MLLTPAVAACHAIVLAAVNVKGILFIPNVRYFVAVLTLLSFSGAVDMDVYGALQICTTGIIAAPIMIKLFPLYVHNFGKATICM
jgi:hypothetical protein